MGSVISHATGAASGARDILLSLAELASNYRNILVRAASNPGIPVSNPTSSYWLDDPPFPSLINSQGPLPSEADVVIIGSGITGVAAAKTILELSRGMSPSVVVLEARELCSGATGRNGGHIKCSPHVEFARLRKTMGPERAREIVRFQIKHLGMLLEVAEQHPRGEVREVETVDLFLNTRDFEQAQRDTKEVTAWIPEVKIDIWDADEARSKFGVNDHVAGAISYTAGALWPYRLVASVWDDLLRTYSNLIIRTETAVSIVKTGLSLTHPYEIHSLKGTIRARHVLHATNAFASQLVPSLAGRLTGVIAHMTAQRPGSHFPRNGGSRSYSIIYSPGFDYISQQQDGADGRPGDLLVGGGLHRSKDQGMDQVGVWDDSRVDSLPLMHIRSTLATVFEPNWGQDGGLIKTWTGILGATGDGLPLVGRLPESKTAEQDGLSGRGQWIAAGYNGEGMVWAWLCGTAIGLMILDKADESLESVAGRPGGKLEDWFPRQELDINSERLRRANLKNAARELF